MKRTFFQKKNGAMVTALMTGPTPESLIAQARGAEFDGADAIGIELRDLKPEYRTREVFERIIQSVNLPFMFIFYRNDRWNVHKEDEPRQELLLAAAEAGAGMIDVMGDLYDPSPDEITHNPEAIEKQKRLIDRIHAMGSQVIMSSHPQRAMTADAVLAQLRSFEERGPDVVKIVTAANTEEEFAESVRTIMLLHRELKKPFVHLCNGKFGRIQRFLGMSLGVSINFAAYRYEEFSLMTQPTVRAMRTVLDNLHWDISETD